jgi:general secretion pathway protein L
MFYKQYLVIDYGTTHIKGVLLKDSFGNISILRKEILPIVNLQGSEENEYEYNLIRFIQSFFPEERNLHLNIPLENVIVRDLSLQLDEEKVLRSIIPAEVESLLPFPMEMMSTRFCIWKIEEENSRTITFSVINDNITQTAEPLIKNQKHIRAIYTNLFSLSCLLFHKREHERIITEEKQAQLDMGGKVSVLNFCLNGKVFFSRYFPIGGETITRKISNRLGISYKDAEEIKMSLSFNIINPGEEAIQKLNKQFKLKEGQVQIILSCIMETLKSILAEVKKSFLVIEPKMVPTEIFLSGGTSLLSGINQYFSDSLGISCRNYELIESDSLGLDKNIYLTCLGEHYHSKLPSKYKVDFMNESISKKVSSSAFQLSKFKPHFILAGIILILFLAVFGISIWNHKSKLRANEEILKSKYEIGFGRKLSDGAEPLAEATAETKKEKDRTEIIRTFYDKDGVLDLILEINNLFPGKEDLDFMLDQFSYDTTSVHIYGRVNELSEIGTIEVALSKSNKFKNIEVMNKRLITGVTKFKASFKIKMDIKSAGK